MSLDKTYEVCYLCNMRKEKLQMYTWYGERSAACKACWPKFNLEWHRFKTDARFYYMFREIGNIWRMANFILSNEEVNQPQ